MQGGGGRSGVDAADGDSWWTNVAAGVNDFFKQDPDAFLVLIQHTETFSNITLASFLYNTLTPWENLLHFYPTKEWFSHC